VIDCRRTSSRRNPAGVPGRDGIPQPLREPRVSRERREVLEILALVAEARKPVIYAGGGIISADAHRELRAFAEATNIPSRRPSWGSAAFPESHPLSMRWFACTAAPTATGRSTESDLLLGFGVRFDDRITGDTHKFAPHAKIVHIDTDASEHHKNKRGQPRDLERYQVRPGPAEWN